MATSDYNEKNNSFLSPQNTYNESQPFRPQSGASDGRSHSQSVSSNGHTLASSRGSATAENREKQRAVRTLPAWVQAVGDDDDDDYLRPPAGSSRYPPRTPPSVRPASHHYTPQPKENAAKGRAFDHEREGVPVTINTPVADQASKWAAFIKASTYGGPNRERGEIMNEQWMQEHMPDLEKPWEPEHTEPDGDDGAGFWLLNPTRRKKTAKKWHSMLMRNAKVPLVFRAWVLLNSIIALGISGSIFHLTGRRANFAEHCPRGSSTYLAIIVDVIAIPYTFYITYDEYINKPLGLRSHGAKMRLLFMDLIFIVFDSANLSVAFESLTDPRWVCRDGLSSDDGSTCSRDARICRRQIALTVILLLALLAWLSTFTISTMRIIDKAMNR